MKKTVVNVIDAYDLQKFLDSVVPGGDSEDLMLAQFPEVSNNTYVRLYLAPNHICPRPMDPYLPQIREELDMLAATESFGEGYVLVRFSW